MPSERRLRIVSQAVRRAPGSKPVVGSSRKISSGSPTSASPRSSRRFWPPESVRTRASRLLGRGRRSRSPRRRRAAARSSRRTRAGSRARSGSGRATTTAARRRPARATRGRRAAGSTPSTSTVAGVALAVALEDLDRRRLAGAVRAEQAEHLARLDLEVDPAQRLVGRRSVLRRPRHRTTRAHSSTSAQRAGRERAPLAGELEDDLAAVGLVADRDDRLAASGDRRRGGRRRVAPGASRSSTSASSPAAAAIGSAVSRARSSGLETTASGCSAASCSPSARAALVPGRVSGRSSSGSPGAASAWRTRNRRTAPSLVGLRRRPAR